ncbi:hypothetical protein ACJQWK_03600 [Exserohilum turcicum]|uniref:Stress-response A/B barrel domain-containing protein n=1 Tax=Exserohilum turcicum (strain 28A) TaxID=671987 RepID=R0KSD0_EXST2|nr:uncharacterized protein SETTUDRAFT_162450 [Exserohilum turcica Et28A]EOA91889.1 hypothetical protein SETTUDRAFT_162450 [Exserohilum turcica Et28A]
MPKIVRLTLLKVADKDTIQQAINHYSTLTQDAKKDGNNYIQLAQANATYEDDRSQGYNLLIRCIFNSVDDMNYFDQQDESHAKIKEMLMPKMDGKPLIIYSDMQGGP